MPHRRSLLFPAPLLCGQFVVPISFVPLKGHVLKHMRQTRDTEDFLDRAGVDARIKRKDRRFRALHEHDRKAISQLLDRDPLFKRSNVLGVEGGGR